MDATDSATSRDPHLNTPAHHNLFPGALDHVRTWQRGRLEARSRAIYSSQALCVSVFGALAVSPNRRRLTQAILDAAGLTMKLGDDVAIECEVRCHRDILNEIGGRNPTSPDVLIRWSTSVLAVEAKFTESLAGCSQAKGPTDSGTSRSAGACSGNYEPGSDLKTKTNAPCRLTVAEHEGSRFYRSPRRYWDLSKRLFRPEALMPPKRPCPFRDSHYQLMRNLCLAAGLAERTPTSDFGFLLVLVDAAPVATETRDEFTEFSRMLLPEVRSRVGIVSYERIAETLFAGGEMRLAEWMKERIRNGIAARRGA